MCLSGLVNLLLENFNIRAGLVGNRPTYGEVVDVLGTCPKDGDTKFVCEMPEECRVT